MKQPNITITVLGVTAMLSPETSYRIRKLAASSNMTVEDTITALLSKGAHSGAAFLHSRCAGTENH